MIDGLTPAAIFILGALLTPFLSAWPRKIFILVLPLLGLFQLYGINADDQGVVELLGYTIVTLRIDALSLIFATIFHIAAFITALYSLHIRDTMQHVAMLVTAGSVIGAVLAGDYISLFLFWELGSIASVFLIWARRTESAYRAGMRYLLIQVGSGLLLMFGAILLSRETGSIAFGPLQLGSLASWAIFLGIGIKCAFPFMHNWLQDAYPESTVTGAVVLVSYTTKLAIYALARSFAGEDILIPIGVAMTVYPVIYAAIDNDFRRVLAYSLNNQLGFMVAAIGLGTELAINGAVAHAVSNVLFKGLLFMSIGAVLLRVGTARVSDLGGLYKSMPWTAGFCLAGAASISALPLFAGFITKGMILAAMANEGQWLVWLVLLFASVGAYLAVDLKLPYFAFFWQDRGLRRQEAPFNMLAAMGVATAGCVLIGVFPGLLFDRLPFAVTYVPYTTDHVITQMQLLLFATLAFAVLVRTGIFPPALPSINLDTDWFYRRFCQIVSARPARLIADINSFTFSAMRGMWGYAAGLAYRVYGPQGVLARTALTSVTVLWVAVLLVATLMLYYL